MISRHWRGLAKRERAGEYVEHLRSKTLPLLTGIAGFIDLSILRRDVPAGVEFVVVTRWSSMDAIRLFAGANASAAVVPAEVRDVMLEYDREVRHYEVVD